MKVFVLILAIVTVVVLLSLRRRVRTTPSMAVGSGPPPSSLHLPLGSIYIDITTPKRWMYTGSDAGNPWTILSDDLSGTEDPK